MNRTALNLLVSDSVALLQVSREQLHELKYGSRTCWGALGCIGATLNGQYELAWAKGNIGEIMANLAECRGILDRARQIQRLA